MPYTREYTLWLCCLTPEQHERTCNYWYTVTTFGSTPHTAFTRRQALLNWLQERGLELSSELPEVRGTFASQRIIGTYRTETHLSYDEFFALKGERTRDLSNGDYTLAIITTGEDGIKTVHTLNPNCHDRPVFDYRTSRDIYC